MFFEEVAKATISFDEFRYRQIHQQLLNHAKQAVRKDPEIAIQILTGIEKTKIKIAIEKLWREGHWI